MLALYPNRLAALVAPIARAEPLAGGEIDLNAFAVAAEAEAQTVCPRPSSSLTVSGEKRLRSMMIRSGSH